MNAKRTEPRVHCYQRPLHGGFVDAARTTPVHLRAVFDAGGGRSAGAPPAAPGGSTCISGRSKRSAPRSTWPAAISRPRHRKA